MSGKAERVNSIIQELSSLGRDVEIDEAMRALIADDLRLAIGKINAGIRELGEYVNIARINAADGDNPGRENPSIKETEAVIQGLRVVRTWIAVAAEELAK